MPHDLTETTGKTDALFVSKSKAWHQKGIIRDVDMTALEAVAELGADFEIRQVESFVEIDGERFSTGHKIVRPKMPWDKEAEGNWVIMSKSPVSYKEDEDGNNIGFYTDTPRGYATMWDKNVGVPVDSVFFMGRKAEEMVITSAVNIADINGDEHKGYIVLFTPFTSEKVVRAANTAVRVVCQNTLKIGLEQAVQKVTAYHNQKALTEELPAWLAELSSRNKKDWEQFVEVGNMLGKQAISDKAAQDYFAQVFTELPKPEKTKFTGTAYDEKMAKWENALNAVQGQRNMAYHVFAGGVQDVYTEGVKGNKWGAYQAVSHVLSHNGLNTNKFASNKDILDGDATKILHRALQLAVG